MELLPPLRLTDDVTPRHASAEVDRTIMVRPSTYETFLLPESPSKEPVPPLSLREKATAVAVNLRLRANAAAVAWQSASCEHITMELRGRKVPRSRSPSRSSPTSRSPPNETTEAHHVGGRSFGHTSFVKPLLMA